MTDVHLGRIFHLALNVTDMNRSIQYYKSLGFEVRNDFTLDEATLGATAAAFGVKPHKHRAVWMQLGNDPRATVIDLVQWFDPPTVGAPYEDGTNVGVTRICFHVDDPEAVYEQLRDRGETFLGPIGYGTPPGGGRSVVFAWKDPDGNVLEVVGGVERMLGGATSQ
jgi:glyoxylase I family protein